MTGKTWTCLAFSAFLSAAWISLGRGSGPIGDGPSWVQEIYLTLQEAFGDKRTQWPEIFIWNQENRGAMFVPGSNRIFLDQKLVTCCARFGDRADDAMAFVIAHEMTHFHQNHRWRLSGLLSDFVVPKLDWDKNHGDEVQADVYGTFLSYQAGYNTFTVVPPLLDSIYAFYNLPATANRLYPSLKERKGLASDACEVSANLIELYQMANYLMVVGRFETAAHLYQHVSNIIQFKEAHYNLGLCRMMSYLATCKDPLSYPISIDSHIPLERTHGQQNPQQMLKSAQRSFELVLEDYDQTYRFAKFALIAIYGWQGKDEQANSLISDLMTSMESSEDPEFLLTMANYYIENSNIAQGKAIYKQLHSNLPVGHRLINAIQQNINLLEGNDTGPTFTPSIQNEQNLDGVTSLLFYSDYQNELVISPGVRFARADQFGSVLSRLTGFHGKFHMQRITSTEIRTSEGLGIGSSLNELTNRWRDENLIHVSHVGGQYVVLWSRGLIFKLDESLATTEWVSFTL